MKEMRADVICVCSVPGEAASLVSAMHGAKKVDFGLFRGFSGGFGSRRVAVVIAGAQEASVYAATRQVAYLLSPRWGLYFGLAGAVCELLKTGDFVLMSEVRRYYCPPALADNLFSDDSLLFSSEDARREVMEAVTVESDPGLLHQALDAVGTLRPAGCIQPGVRAVRGASSDEELHGWRAREFVRGKYRVDVVDSGSYGFLCAAADAGLPGIGMASIGDECGEVGRRPAGKLDRKWLRIGAEYVLHIVQAISSAR